MRPVNIFDNHKLQSGRMEICTLQSKIDGKPSLLQYDIILIRGILTDGFNEIFK